MVEHKRLYSLLQLIQRLSRPGGYDIPRLAEIFGVSTRSIYRYLDLIRECGFRIEKYGNRFRIEKRGSDENLLPLLSWDEATLLRDSVLAMPAGPQRSELLKKLEILGDPAPLADMIIDASAAKIIKELAGAIQRRERVVLKDYHSTGSGTIRDRLVEPVGFSVNMRYLHAFVPDLEEMRLFKPERISGIENTGELFELTSRHRIVEPDYFGMNGTPRDTVTLSLNLRALMLLLEEFPQVSEILQEEGVALELLQGAEKKTMERKRDDQEEQSDEETNGEASPASKRYTLKLKVNGYEGVGRFVLGLPGEAEVVGPESFREYIIQRLGRSSLLKKKQNTQETSNDIS